MLHSVPPLYHPDTVGAFVNDKHMPTRKTALVFDVETTGLLQRNGVVTIDGLKVGDAIVQFDQLPYITQISFIMYDENTKTVLRKYNQYIRLPDNVVIPEIVTRLTGITAEICNEKGIDIVEALTHFNCAYRSSDNVVCHNFDFDHRMIQIEYLRNKPSITHQIGYDPMFFNKDLDRERGVEIFCTMLKGVTICNIMVNRRKDPKWPTLTELHQKLFGVIPEGMHDSMIDVIATLRCYEKMI